MVLSNYQFIQNQIIKIRPQDPPKLIAVSKKQPLFKIQEALHLGIRFFGENQIKEGIEKFTEQKKTFPDLELHHIGPVQTGNLRKLFGLYSYTHGVGSLNSLQELVKQANARKANIKYFLQVNLSREDSKSGFEKNELLQVIKSLATFKSDYAEFHGFMTMGPSDADIEKTRNIFRELNLIRKEYCPKAKLSMGMSNDYLIAAEEGSDYIRVGSAIFGERLLK